MVATKLNVNEIFHSVQGEGVYIGMNAVFIRLSQCNLRCEFCDTQYHWKGHKMTISHIVKEVEKYNSHSVIITGGEPLLQDLTSLLKRLQGKYVTVETNGTILPSEEVANLVHHWSISPKLVSSGNDLDKRINYDVLKNFKHLGCIFKFVVSNQKDLDEVKFLQKKIEIENQQIYLMKEGATAKEQYVDLPAFIEKCRDLGYNFSPRLHVMVWDNKRSV